MLGRGRWGEGALEKPPARSGPGRGRGNTDGQRAGSATAVRVRAGPGAGSSGGSSGGVLDGGEVWGAIISCRGSG